MEERAKEKEKEAKRAAFEAPMEPDRLLHEEGLLARDAVTRAATMDQLGQLKHKSKAKRRTCQHGKRKARCKHCTRSTAARATASTGARRARARTAAKATASTARAPQEPVQGLQTGNRQQPIANRQQPTANSQQTTAV
jgi:hypothetical protein